jgi:hypothetical protein
MSLRLQNRAAFADHKKADDALFCALCVHVSQETPVFMGMPKPDSAARDFVYDQCPRHST